MHEPTNLLPYFSRHMNLNLTLPHIGSDQRDLSRIYICTHGKSASLRASVSLFVGYYFPKRRREIRLRPSSRSFANAFGVSPQDAHRDALILLSSLLLIFLNYPLLAKPAIKKKRTSDDQHRESATSRGTNHYCALLPAKFYLCAPRLVSSRNGASTTLAGELCAREVAPRVKDPARGSARSPRFFTSHLPRDILKLPLPFGVSRPGWLKNIYVYRLCTSTYA